MYKRLLIAALTISSLTAVAQKESQVTSVNPIYCSEQGKALIMDLYYEKLSSLNSNYFCKEVSTNYATSNVVIVGDTTLPKIILIHGINSGSSIAIDPLKELTDTYCIYAVDIPGQPTLSEQKRLSVKDDSYGHWLNEVMEQLEIEEAPVVAISYGAFVLQRLMDAHPNRVGQSIFIVPMGIVNGNIFKLLTKVLLPMMKYQRSQEREDLLKFMDAFYSEKSDFYIRHQKAILDHFKMDFRRPAMIKKKEMKQNDTPVYVVAAEKDIFFPGKKVIRKARKIFSNFKQGVILENSKHVPHSRDYDKLQKTVRSFLEER